MSKFAKLFERDGEQVLAICTQTDDGLPCLHFMVSIDEAMVEPKLIFKDGDWDTLGTAFDAVDEEGAFNMRSDLVTKYGDMV